MLLYSILIIKFLNIYRNIQIRDLKLNLIIALIVLKEVL